MTTLMVGHHIASLYRTIRLFSGWSSCSSLAQSCLYSCWNYQQQYPERSENCNSHTKINSLHLDWRRIADSMGSVKKIRFLQDIGDNCLPSSKISFSWFKISNIWQTDRATILNTWNSYFVYIQWKWWWGSYSLWTFANRLFP